MALFGNLKSDGLTETQDRLGGYQPFETGIYTGKIKMAYAGKAASGAQSVTLILDLKGREYRETIYITNKGGDNYFINKEDKKSKVPLPGFTTIDDICLVTTGSALADQPGEEKVVNIYDIELKREVPKSVPMLVDLLGKEVSVGIVKSLENKSVKNGSGVYEPTAETRLTNHIDKVFHTETKMTVAEARQGVETAAFWDAWAERNTGQTRDKRTIKDGAGGTPGRPGAPAGGPPQAGAPTATRKSLFAARA